jgi:HNH endonuclease
MSNRAKKDQWVREAVGITDAITSKGCGRYLCPLCLEWFTDLDDLSLEHAPPASVGGRHMAVTCRACNSTAGATVDAALRWAETVRDFGFRKMTKSMQATFEFAGIEQRVEATFRPDGLSIFVSGSRTTLTQRGLSSPPSTRWSPTVPPTSR